MIHQIIYLCDSHPECCLQTYIHKETRDIVLPPRKAMIICPGGSYENLSPREADPIAEKFYAEGLNVFLFSYSLYPNAGNFLPLIELSMAIIHIRENAEKYYIDPNNIFVTGFSAGGHLAASAATLWNCDAVCNALGIEDGKRSKCINRPTGVILCYPVITGGKHTHSLTMDHVCGDVNITEEKRNLFSLEKQVNFDTCPAFIWHTFNDNLVSVQNTLLYINAMAEKGIPFEAHIYPYGQHGLALGTEQTAGSSTARINEHISNWFGLAMKWIKDFDKITEVMKQT